jgi:hypothetical protein
MALLPLVLKWWREILIGALIVALMGACVSRDHRIAAGAVAKEQSRQADSVLRVVTPQLYHTDTIFIKDTVVVRRAVDRVITLRDTVLQHLSDTVLVREFVTRADSAAQACSELLNTCSVYRQQATAEIAALKAKVAVAPIIQTRSCVASDVLWGAIGIGAGYLAHRR